MKRYDLIDGQMVEKTLGDYIRYNDGGVTLEQVETLLVQRKKIQQHEATIAELRARLARQQAPVGDSVDTTALRFLLLNYRSAKSAGGIDTALNDIFAHITAWKDAQLARERQGDLKCFGWVQFVDGVQTQNFARDAAELKLVKKISETMSKPGQRIEYVPVFSTPAPQAQGEPVAWMVGLDVFKFKAHAERNVRNPDLKPIPLGVLGPAPQADEVRDAARYRWFVNNWIQPNPLHRWQPRFGEKHASGGVMWRGVYTEAEFDAAIDAAMAINRSR